MPYFIRQFLTFVLIFCLGVQPLVAGLLLARSEGFAAGRVEAASVIGENVGQEIGRVVHNETAAHI